MLSKVISTLECSIVRAYLIATSSLPRPTLLKVPEAEALISRL